MSDLVRIGTNGPKKLFVFGIWYDYETGVVSGIVRATVSSIT